MGTAELDLVRATAAAAQPLTGPDALDPILDRIGDARIVMIGEASHGTHDFDRLRAALTPTGV